MSRRSPASSVLTGVATLTLLAALAGCGGGGRDYDIGPIFPLSVDKCAKYHGDESGSGVTSTCLVTKSECERAAKDWRQAMRDGAVTDAINFSCD